MLPYITNIVEYLIIIYRLGVFEIIVLNPQINSLYSDFCEEVLKTDLISTREKLIISLVVNNLKGDKEELKKLVVAAKSEDLSNEQLGTISALAQLLWFEDQNSILEDSEDDDSCCQ